MYVLNIALPIVSLVLLINVATAWSDTTFALEVNYNDKTIGYVQSEAVYKEARELAFDRLDVSATSSVVTDDGKEAELIGDADYKIKAVKLSQINNASEICDKLIENGVKNVEKGVFGADMKVELLNDGPVTILYDSEMWRK